MCNRTIEMFDAALIQRARVQQVTSNVKPIFVVGMPRSGSTLIEQILSSHPEVFDCGEVSFVKHILYDMQMVNRRSEYIPADLSDRLSQEMRLTMAEKYGVFVQPKNRTASTIVDKYLLNFWYLGFIHLMFPDATIIHCSRAREANLHSCYTPLFFEAQRYTYDLNDLVSYHNDYLRLMNHWSQVLPKGVLVRVELEDLVENPEPVIRKLISDCGLTWQSQCLKPHENQRFVTTASAVQVKQPIHKHVRRKSDKFNTALATAITRLSSENESRC